MTQFLEIKADLQVKDTGEITGLAWPWGIPDRVGDVMTKGALSAPNQLPMLWSHDQSEVIGVWSEITDTGAGVEVKGQLLVDDIPKAKEVHALIKSKAVNGLSIGFETKDSKRNPKGRTITQANLLEISIVAVPCHPDAQITSLKAGGTEPIEKKEISKMEKEEIEALIAEQIAQLTPANDAPDADTKAFDAVQKRLDQLEAKAARPQGVHVVQNKDKELEQKAFGNFLRRGVERMDADEVKALTVGTDADGGYLVPEENGNELIKLLNEFSPIRQYARVINTSASEIVYPRRVSGTSATWTAETATRTGSGMEFEQVKLPVHELATFTDVSNKLLEDNAYGLEGELLQDFAESFAKKEGQAFISGDGTIMPKGIMAAGNGIAEIKSGHASTLGVSAADTLIATFHKIASVYAQNGVWMMNRNTLSAIRQLADTTGRFMVIDPISEAAPSTLLGRPVVEMPDMDDIGAGKFPILFGDMSGYRIVDRIGLTTLRDPYSLATAGQVRFHARKRVGGDLTHPDRFIKLKIAA
ncbi:phage major capsid protein [Tateyamaria sp. SN3-11]|uniref:phage major capsid protein n=1 Tax=Tateyamaria sp. SN3-11 TaxID=3092147 RepID=UPI0039E78834